MNFCSSVFFLSDIIDKQFCLLRSMLLFCGLSICLCSSIVLKRLKISTRFLLHCPISLSQIVLKVGLHRSAPSSPNFVPKWPTPVDLSFGVDLMNVYVFMEKPLQSYRKSPAIRAYAVLYATRRKRTCPPPLIISKQAGTRFTYPDGWKTESTYVAGYIPRLFTLPQTVTNNSIINRARRRASTLPQSHATTQYSSIYATRQFESLSLWLCIV